MVADLNKELSASLGLLNEDGSSKRATVILDKSLQIRHYSYNEKRVGRSTKEILRLIGAIKHVDSTPEGLCMVNWDE